MLSLLILRSDETALTIGCANDGWFGYGFRLDFAAFDAGTGRVLDNGRSIQFIKRRER